MQKTSGGELLDIDDVRTLVTQELKEYIGTKKLAANTIAPAYATLWRSIENLAIAGGKRFRSYMVYLAYSAYPGRADESTWKHAASAVELLHLALLVHDDIIDRDYIRYGIRNVSGQQYDAYAPHIADNIERQHFADSAAILAGDLLIAGAYDLLSRTTASRSKITSAQMLLDEAIFRVAGGELIDTESAFMEPRESPLLIAQEKTASYSFCGPLAIGATLAGASQEAIEHLQKFGLSLGIAFQLQDDLLGMFGDEAELGKSAVSDLREGKYTYLVEQFHTVADESQQKIFANAFGVSTATPAEQGAAKSALIESGARSIVEEKIHELEQAARATMEDLRLEAQVKAAFDTFITKCTKRSS